MIKGLESTVADAASKAMWMAVEKLYWEKRDWHYFELKNTLPSFWTKFEDAADYRGVMCRLISAGTNEAGNITRVNIQLRNDDETWHLEAIYQRDEDTGPFMFWLDVDWSNVCSLEMSSGYVSYVSALGDTTAAVRWLTYWKMLQPSDESEE